MGYKGEKTGHIGQEGVLKEKEYIDFFLNCERAGKNYKKSKITDKFCFYGDFISTEKALKDTPEKVYGIDSSHIEQSIENSIGSISKFMSEFMMISTLSETVIDMDKLQKIEKMQKQKGVVSPSDIKDCSESKTFNFWFNGANLIPKNLDKYKGVKNGFKVAVRDALKKPDAIIKNNNAAKGVFKNPKSPNQKEYDLQDIRLIDVLYDVLEKSNSPLIRNFTFERFRGINENSVINNSSLPTKIKAIRCPNSLCQKDIHKNLFLGQYIDNEIFCPHCDEVICELDVIYLTDSFQEEMSNLNLLSDISYLMEHLRGVQILTCMEKEDNIAIVMDGTLGLFKNLKFTSKGIKKIVQTKLMNGSTIFGVIKHSPTKDFFEAIDNGKDTIKNGSFWIVRNDDRYKYITPRFKKDQIHGEHTHYGVDVMVKTTKGYRFLVSVAIPGYVESVFNSNHPNSSIDDFYDYIQLNYKIMPFFVKMLLTIEKIQMLLYGGSTIPQTLTHGNASISWNVSGRILAKAVSDAKKNGV